MERLTINPAMEPASLILDNFDNSQFANFWQQKPLFLKNGLRALPFAVEAVDLCRLVFDSQYADMVTTRFIYQTGETWHHETGPLQLKDVLNVISQPDTTWTILIDSVDRVWSQIGLLWSVVDFLPNWAKDDIMISLAGPGGGVGPHADNYDVFLVQLCGRRTWHLEKDQRANPARDFLPDLPLRILPDFETDVSYETGPGDVLYLPPKLSHWGIADDIADMAPQAGDFESFAAGISSVTASLGFRSPNLENLYAYLAGQGKLNEDTVLPIDMTGSTDGALNAAYTLLNSQEQKPDAGEGKSFNEFLHGFADPSLPLFLPERGQSVSELQSRLKSGDVLFWGGGTFPGFTDGKLLLGRRHVGIPSRLEADIQTITGRFYLDLAVLEKMPFPSLRLVNALFNDGYLFWWQDQIE